jgi:hypothetical protein
MLPHVGQHKIFRSLSFSLTNGCFVHLLCFEPGPCRFFISLATIYRVLRRGLAAFAIHKEGRH